LKKIQAKLCLQGALTKNNGRKNAIIIISVWLVIMRGYSLQYSHKFCVILPSMRPEHLLLSFMQLYIKVLLKES